MSFPVLRCLRVREQSCPSCADCYGAMVKQGTSSKGAPKKAGRKKGAPAPPQAPIVAPAAPGGGLDILLAALGDPVPAAAAAAPDKQRAVSRRCRAAQVWRICATPCLSFTSSERHRCRLRKDTVTALTFIPQYDSSCSRAAADRVCLFVGNAS